MKPLAREAAVPPSGPEAKIRSHGAERRSALARLRGRWRLLLVATIAAGAVGWSVMWFVAAQQIAANLGDWRAQEQAAGRSWTCTDQKLGGFPFNIEARCIRLRMQASAGSASFDGTVSELDATAQVYAPHVIDVAVRGPLDMHTSDRGQLHATWKSLFVELTFGAYGLDDLRIRAQSPQLRAEAPHFAPLAADARRADAHFTAIAGYPIGETPYRFSANIADGRQPALDRLIGNNGPATIEADGIVNHLDAAAAGDLAAVAETWRRSGGRIELSKAVLRQGETEIMASGRLDIDAAHRLHGVLDASGTGLEPILARYGVPREAVALDGLLTSLFGASAARADPSRPALSVPLRFENGRVFIGPARMPFALPPLY